MIRPDHETAHLKIVGTISQQHVISLRLERSNVTREEKQIQDNRCCQLTPMARILFHSEKQSVEKHMGDVLCFHGMLGADRCQL